MRAARGVLVAAFAACFMAGGGAATEATPETISRDLEPVIVGGSALAAMQGGPVSQVGVYRYNESAARWDAIPSQVDERANVTLTGGTCGTHVQNMVAPDDGLLDADDEVVFMAADLGDRAPAGSRPPGGQSLAYELEVSDPLTSGRGWAYVVPASVAPPADYVSYATTRTLPDTCGPTATAESTTADTSQYQMHFAGRWTIDALQLKPGADILDKYRGTLGPPDSPSETEFTWDQYSVTQNFKDGPVRALRIIRGAASGPHTINTIEFYRSYIRMTTNLRVHAVPQVYRFLDYNSAAVGMTYYRSTNTSGFTIDGLADSPGNALGSWEEISGSPGTAVYYAKIETNAGAPQPYYRDATGVTERSGGDGHSYGNHGQHFPTIADTDCTPGNFMRSTMAVYVLPPNQGRVGDAYAAFEENPLQTTATLLPFDSDGDGWSDAAEGGIGTNPTSPCGVDAWPPDLNNDTFVDITDVSSVTSVFGVSVPPAPARYDVAPETPDGFIDITDVARLTGLFGEGCTLAGGVLATFDVVGEQFKVWVTNPQTAQQLFDLRDGKSNARIPNGRILAGAGRGGHNAPWSWHLDPVDIQMAEAAIKVCDATPSFVEENRDYFIETIGRYCPWSAQLVALVDHR